MLSAFINFLFLWLLAILVILKVSFGGHTCSDFLSGYQAIDSYRSNIIDEYRPLLLVAMIQDAG